VDNEQGGMSFKIPSATIYIARCSKHQNSHEPYWRPKPHIFHKTHREKILGTPLVAYKYRHLLTKSPSFLSMEFASLLRRSSRTVTTARAPARRERPGSHEQYLPLLKSTVTRLIRRVPDRRIL